jgi:hypothetical protein
MKSKEIQALSLEKFAGAWAGSRPSFEKFGGDLEILDREWNFTQPLRIK